MSATNTYLENQVLTATPQKLRLFLIGGAIRFAHAALKHWEEGNNEEAFEAVIRSRAIVTELLSVVQPEEFEPAAQVVALYAYLFRELSEAQLHRDPERVRAVIAVLEEERQTWRQLCEQLPDAPTTPHAQAPKEITVSTFPAEAINSALRIDAPQETRSFSLDA